MTSTHDELLKEFREFARSAPKVETLMEHIAKRLHDKMARYNWAGFYLVDPTDSNFLVVGPFAGSFTPNVRIRLTVGLCGLAATTGKVVVVQDVSKDPRYLAGSTMVKSEIVVPIFARKKLAAELDVESYFANTFTAPEQEFAEAVSKIVADYLEKS